MNLRILVEEKQLRKLFKILIKRDRIEKGDESALASFVKYLGSYLM